MKRGRSKRAADASARVALLCLFVLGCSNGSGPPNWIEHPHRQFSEKRYVTGVGQGPDRPAADEAARAEIARRTAGETEGIEIARRWRAKAPRVHWALAVLDRPALVARLTERIAQTDQQLATVSTEPTDARPPQRIANALSAIALIQQRDALRDRIAHLEGDPPSPETSPSRNELEARLSAAKQAFAIAVEAYEMDPISGAPGETLDSARRALAQQVLARGFALPPESEWGDAPAVSLRVRARIAFDPLDLGHRQDFRSIQWEASLEIEDPAAGGPVIALLSDRARATHLNAHSTRRLAQEQAIEFLAQALSTWLDAHYAPRP
ncbi:MAG: hypothetical protein R3F35_04835 [Myxococcota bacterium]